MAIERTAGDGEDRTAKTLLRLFRGLAKQRSAALPLIGGDRWPASIKAMAKKANQAVHILDRLHILPRIRKARDEVRGAEGEQRKKDGYGRILPRARWLLWNWPENITEHHARKLKEILQDNLKSLPHCIT